MNERMPEIVADGMVGRWFGSRISSDSLSRFLSLAILEEYHGLAFLGSALRSSEVKTERNAQTDTIQTATHASTSSQKYS